MPIRVEMTSYGYRAEVEVPVTPEDHAAWIAKLEEMTESRGHFSQIIDVRRAHRLNERPEQQGAVQELMRFVKAHGLVRSAVIVPTSRTALQIKQMAFGTEVLEWERYIDGSDPECEAIALDWVERGIDPDRRPRSRGGEV
jgi:hypothetical protein